MDFIESLFTVNDYPVTPPMRAAMKEALEEMRGIPKTSRTMTSFLHYCQYQDGNNRPVFKEQLKDYQIDGGKYGKIFDAAVSDISLDARFIAFEMEALMNQGQGCVVPALLYLFNLVEKKFDGRLTLLVLDEAWLFLKNEMFALKFAEWLKVLRKKNVFVVFATQDVADVQNSPLMTTVVQQCLTKIYLADPSAATDRMAQVYSEFGLTESEIYVIASSVMKRDYFYTSPLGRRLFRLDLGEVTLGLIGAADHAELDGLVKGKAAGSSFCSMILDAKGIEWRRLAGEDAPLEPQPLPAPVPQAPAVAATATVQGGPPKSAARRAGQKTAEQDAPPKTGEGSAKAREVIAALKALALYNGKYGSGRDVQNTAKHLGVSRATVYQARSVLALAPGELVAAVMDGGVSIKAAYSRLNREKAQAEETA